jgi:hypothetical protein
MGPALNDFLNLRSQIQAKIGIKGNLLAQTTEDSCLEENTSYPLKCQA